jgi:hypothetical protein
MPGQFSVIEFIRYRLYIVVNSDDTMVFLSEVIGLPWAVSSSGLGRPENAVIFPKKRKKKKGREREVLLSMNFIN